MSSKQKKSIKFVTVRTISVVSLNTKFLFSKENLTYIQTGTENICKNSFSASR